MPAGKYYCSYHCSIHPQKTSSEDLPSMYHVMIIHCFREWYQITRADNFRFIPGEWRPPIWVRVLPALENIIYGANLSNILSEHKAVLLDVLAWFPYGITHFGAPVVCSAVLFVFSAPGTLPVFSKSFGYMNLIGVLIQICFPCSPPCMCNPRR